MSSIEMEKTRHFRAKVDNNNNYTLDLVKAYLQRSINSSGTAF